MTDLEAASAIREFEYRRQNAAAEFLRGLWMQHELERVERTGHHCACSCLALEEGDYVKAYEYAKDR